LGLLIAGPVADALGVQVWYLAGGLATLALGIVGFFIPAVMQIEEQRAGLRKEMAVG
jgi:DHA3 family macrolide efflux protein-like MFS transporter